MLGIRPGQEAGNPDPGDLFFSKAGLMSDFLSPWKNIGQKFKNLKLIYWGAELSIPCMPRR